MNEDFLHYIWLQELHEKNYRASTGEHIQVLSSGERNRDAGPDFQNARIKIDDTIWAGNVEIHIDSANWSKHKHHLDPAYDNVILHVVNTSTKEACRSNGQIVPTIELAYDPGIYETYRDLVENKCPIPCEKDIDLIDNFIVSIWLNALCIERLESKSEIIQTVYGQTGKNWEETFYIMLARSFGFNTNALPFEMLAKSLPLKILLKNRHNIKSLEALLFGQAGFLDDDSTDEYYCLLQNEYQYFKKVYNLKPVEKHLWKFMRLRPVNFPTIRLAQFANLIHRTNHLFSNTLEATSIKELLILYECTAAEYWDTHYNFGKETVKKEKKTGKLALQIVLINTVIPFLFIYGKKRNIKELRDKAIQFLEEIPAEKNSILKNWEKIGIKAINAMQGQALIQLTKQYCNKKNCLFCQLGNSIIHEKLRQN